MLAESPGQFASLRTSVGVFGLCSRGMFGQSGHCWSDALQAPRIEPFNEGEINAGVPECLDSGLERALLRSLAAPVLLGKRRLEGTSTDA